MTLGETGTLQAGQSRSSAPATGSKEERAAPEQSVGGISSGMCCGRSPGRGRAGTLPSARPPAPDGLGLPRLGGVGGSQAGETEAPIRHVVAPQPPSQGLALGATPVAAQLRTGVFSASVSTSTRPQGV